MVGINYNLYKQKIDKKMIHDSMMKYFVPEQCK